MVAHGFHDDDRTIDDKPEVYRTEAHQVSAHAEELHHPEGEQHGQWNHGGYHKSCAVVAKEQHEDKDHNQPSLYQVASDGSRHAVHQLRAVDEGFDDHAFGQAFLYLRHALLYILYHLLEILTFEHQRDTGHDLALAVPCHGSIAGGISELHICHVPYEYRSTANGLHGNFPDVLQRRGETYTADEILVAVLLDVAAAGILVARFEGVIHVRHGQPRCVQSVGVNRHLVLLHVSAPSAHFGYALRAGQLLAHNPVLHRAQVGKAILVFVAFFRA